MAELETLGYYLCLEVFFTLGKLKCLQLELYMAQGPETADARECWVVLCEGFNTEGPVKLGDGSSMDAWVVVRVTEDGADWFSRPWRQVSIALMELAKDCIVAIKVSGVVEWVWVWAGDIPTFIGFCWAVWVGADFQVLLWLASWQQ